MILAIFSLVILLPLLWIVRVSLTDKLTAYKIPPEIGTLGLMNYIDDLPALSLRLLVREQPHRRARRDR